MTSTTALKMEGVSKRFGAREALRGLDLEVPAGAIFGLIGPNGAGKTTAFSIACGFLRADAGEIRILDLAGGPRGVPASQLKGRVGALPQDAALGRETSCLDHLVFLARLQGLAAAEARTQSERLLGEVGLADRARSRVKTLSHGMLRRLTIAQALLGQPELILLDEPTSGLDPRHAHAVRELLVAAARGGAGGGSRRAVTLVVSSHNLTELEALCDHVAFIDEGKVVAAGPTDVLTGKGQDVEINLGEGPQPLEALRAALPEDDVAWEPATRLIRIRFRPSPDRQAEDVIGVAARALLDGGARLAGIRRGTSLEKKFLEMS
jgi:ABC-type multidrug transport system ATPase subunit